MDFFKKDPFQEASTFISHRFLLLVYRISFPLVVLAKIKGTSIDLILQFFLNRAVGM